MIKQTCNKTANSKISLFILSAFFHLLIFLPVSAACSYRIIGDLNNDCRIDMQDYAIIAMNWMVDCNVNPLDTACIPKQLEAGNIIITEIMANPARVYDSNGEWFEIYNATSHDIDVQGLEIADSGSNYFVITQSLVISAGSRLVLGRNGKTSENGGVDVDYVYTNFSLVNSGDSIIISQGGVIIDQVNYNSTWPLVVGKSISLDRYHHDGTSNDSAANWCAAQSVYGLGDYGTPGIINDICR